MDWAAKLAALVALLGTDEVTDWETEFITYVRDNEPTPRMIQVTEFVYDDHFGVEVV